MSKKELVLSAITVLMSVAIVTVAVSAATGGLLTPPSRAFDAGVPVRTMHTLDDIYNKTKPCNATTDTTTGLMWQNDPGVAIPWYYDGTYSPSSPDASLEDAINYCLTLKQCGVTWHLPTKAELIQGLIDQYGDANDICPTCTKPSPATLGGFQDGYGCWSSTPDAGFSGNAWYANFRYGYVYPYSGNMTSQYLVRCVTSIQ